MHMAFDSIQPASYYYNLVRSLGVQYLEKTNVVLQEQGIWAERLRSQKQESLLIGGTFHGERAGALGD